MAWDDDDAILEVVGRGDMRVGHKWGEGPVTDADYASARDAYATYLERARALGRVEDELVALGNLAGTCIALEDLDHERRPGTLETHPAAQPDRLGELTELVG